jgi:hypothetical protein
MKKIDHSDSCKQRRSKQRPWALLNERVRQRLTDHVAACPRCQKRLALANRVELAMNLLKSQPHDLELLSRANTRAVGVLKHSLRHAPQSEKLRRSRPDHNWIEKKRPLIERMLNLAACLFVVIMIRMGVMSSMRDVQTRGKAVLHTYYARSLDSQLVNEIFPDDTAQA